MSNALSSLCGPDSIIAQHFDHAEPSGGLYGVLVLTSHAADLVYRGSCEACHRWLSEWIKDDCGCAAVVVKAEIQTVDVFEIPDLEESKERYCVFKNLSQKKRRIA